MTRNITLWIDMDCRYIAEQKMLLLSARSEFKDYVMSKWFMIHKEDIYQKAMKCTKVIDTEVAQIMCLYIGCRYCLSIYIYLYLSVSEAGSCAALRCCASVCCWYLQLLVARITPYTTHTGLLTKNIWLSENICVSDKRLHPTWCGDV